MKVRYILVILALIAGVAAGASSVSAQDWVRIGEKGVESKVDHDTIISQNEAKIHEVHLQVKYAPVKFNRVVIRYRNGDKQDLAFRENVRLGRDSRAIPIEGNGHAIKAIHLWYEPASLGGKKAKVIAYGR
jgi:hypothetical protein